MAYHPQSNGACERMNRTLLHLLETCVYECPTDWDLFLEEVTFAYNTTPHRSTQRSPFSILYGDEARLPCELLLGSPQEAEPLNEFVANLIRRTADISETARLVANAAQRTSKDYYDVNINCRLYKTGDVVCVRRGQKKVGECAKLAPKWEGPCLVTRVRGVMIEVVMPNDTKRWIHHDRLSGPIPQKYRKVEGGKRGRPRKNPSKDIRQSDDEAEDQQPIVVAKPATVQVQDEDEVDSDPPDNHQHSQRRDTVWQDAQGGAPELTDDSDDDYQSVADGDVAMCESPESEPEKDDQDDECEADTLDVQEGVEVPPAAPAIPSHLIRCTISGGEIQRQLRNQRLQRRFQKIL